MRCMFQYRRDAKDGAANVHRVYLVREGLGRLPPEDVVAEVGASNDEMNEVRESCYYLEQFEGYYARVFSVPFSAERGMHGVFLV